MIHGIIDRLKKRFVIAIMTSSISACGPAKLISKNRTDNAYADAVEVVNLNRIVFVSGQVPVTDNNLHVASGFDEQCRAVWDNIENQLHASGMKLSDIAKVTTYLADRKYSEQNYKLRKEVLKDHAPAVTVIITDIYDEAWLLEIEVIAVR